MVLIFQDVTTARRLQDELEHANRQLEAAYEELQSTNEELETMNEELQSTNDELQDRTTQLRDVNSFMEAILTGLQAGVVVLNRDMQILIWNRRAVDLWGVRAEEAVGQHFLNIDIGLSTEQLRPAIRSVLSGNATQEESLQAAINRRGRTIEMRITCTPLSSESAGVTGAILIMEPVDGAGSTAHIPVGVSEAP